MTLIRLNLDKAPGRVMVPLGLSYGSSVRFQFSSSFGLGVAERRLLRAAQRVSDSQTRLDMSSQARLVTLPNLKIDQLVYTFRP